MSNLYGPRTVTSAEDECRRQTELRESAARDLADLAAKYEAKQSAAADLEVKVKVSGRSRDGVRSVAAHVRGVWRRRP